MSAMETGDKVMVVLGAKALCCFLLALAAAGALGGFGAWLIGGMGRWVAAGIVLALIVWAVFARRRRASESERQPHLFPH